MRSTCLCFILSVRKQPIITMHTFKELFPHTILYLSTSSLLLLTGFVFAPALPFRSAPCPHPFLLQLSTRRVFIHPQINPYINPPINPSMQSLTPGPRTAADRARVLPLPRRFPSTKRRPLADPREQKRRRRLPGTRSNVAVLRPPFQKSDTRTTSIRRWWGGE